RQLQLRAAEVDLQAQRATAKKIHGLLLDETPMIYPAFKHQVSLSHKHIDGLQRQDGQAFTATNASGTPLAEDAGTNGAGSLVTQSTESSNVDIASEFTKLIVAQRAYSANTKMVTTADDMLQQTIDMKR
ncbi:MAG: flagellar hook-basal body complex protein, partial [Alphaproteobacteria bacterium]|nr:flagellar hook-basal body complex protein [Alphaproteobacteria bacterium]